jgi:hypothetical protein
MSYENALLRLMIFFDKEKNSLVNNFRCTDNDLVHINVLLTIVDDVFYISNDFYNFERQEVQSTKPSENTTLRRRSLNFHLHQFSVESISSSDEKDTEIRNKTKGKFHSKSKIEDSDVELGHEVSNNVQNESELLLKNEKTLLTSTSVPSETKDEEENILLELEQESTTKSPNTHLSRKKRKLKSLQELISEDQNERTDDDIHIFHEKETNCSSPQRKRLKSDVEDVLTHEREDIEILSQTQSETNNNTESKWRSPRKNKGSINSSQLC